MAAWLYVRHGCTCVMAVRAWERERVYLGGGTQVVPRLHPDYPLFVRFALKAAGDSRFTHFPHGLDTAGTPRARLAHPEHGWHTPESAIHTPESAIHTPESAVHPGVGSTPRSRH